MKKWMIALQILGVSMVSNISASSSNTVQFTEPAMKESYVDFQDRVRQTIANSPKLASIENELVEFFNQLVETGHMQAAGSDADVRPLFVNLQGVIENTLAIQLFKGQVTDLVGVIHTPTPATPLCTDGSITERLVDPSMSADTARINTVRARANILRDYLEMGGNLHVVYPKEGLQKRSEVQQNIYMAALEAYPKALYDTPIDLEAMDSDMVGATYVFRNAEGEQYLFSLRATQANAPEEDNQWEMWLGPVEQFEISERYYRVQEFLLQNNGPELTI